MTTANQVTQQPQIENTIAYSLSDLYHARRVVEFYGRHGLLS